MIDKILELKALCWCLRFNEHKSNYMELKDYIERCGLDFISKEDEQRAIETDTLYELIWYPDTPVGSVHMGYSSLENLIKHLIAGSAHDQKNNEK